MFEIIQRDKNSKARLGLLTTPHGTIETPSYVMVGTYGRFRNLSPADIKKTKTQLIIANTFHLWDWALQRASLHYKDALCNRLGLYIPTMTDSGGFQVLSLAFGMDNRVGKFITDNAKITKAYERRNVRITKEGVHFKYMGKNLFLGPKLSMQLQSKIGADIVFAFDHITGPLDNRAYNQRALQYTDKWAKECIAEHNKLQKKRINKQILFGIVQGGIYKDLREKSAKSIGSMQFDGFGIGGSYTQKQISEILRWVIPYLPEEKPRHLLGVGKIADIFEAIENGMDTFDCVIPTREARHGRLYTKTGHLDIRKGKYLKDRKIIEKGCRCPTCSSKISRLRIRELIKSQSRILNSAGQRWCLMHNMWFFNKLLKDKI